MNISRKKEIIKLLNIWGNFGIYIRNYKMEFSQLLEICKGLKDIRALCYENKAYTKSKNIVNSAEKVSTNSLKLYEEKMQTLNQSLNSNMTIKNKMEELVNTLDPNEQVILRARFLQHIKWEQIPARLPVGYSLRQCYRAYDTALEKLDQLIIKNNEMYGDKL